MLRRVTGIGMLLLAATGCANWRGQIGDIAPGDLATPTAAPTASAQNASNSVISRSAPDASPIPTTIPASSASPLEKTQATSTHPNWGQVTNAPAPIMPPPIHLDPMATTVLPREPAERLEDPVVVALRCIIEKRNTEAIDQLNAYGPMTREVFQEVLPAIAALSGKGLEDLNADDVALVDLTLKRVTEMIRPRAALSISQLCFCDAVTGFTIYRPLPEDHVFLAARGDRPGELVQLYMEMKNLGSRPDAGQFVTDLACEVEIVDERGRSRWSHRFRPEDLRLASRSRLMEYYHNFSFYLPESLTPGNYRLVVRLSDRTHPELPRDATSSAPLHIVGDR